ncbi:MAG: dihydroneopterin aldolase [Candidatus Cryptobacteroides sp.]
MENIGILELEGMEFHSYHGCLEKEKREGNLFTVDFRGELDMASAVASDSLGDTLDYGLLYDIVAEQMAIPSDLLENVTGRIVERIATVFPELKSFSIRVSKRNPPVNGPVSWSRTTLFYPPKCSQSNSEKQARIPK